MADVLIVDDSSTLRRILRDALSSEPRLKTVAEAANGEEAIAVLERRPIDLVLLDLEMPVMDGQTALRIIKQRWPDLPVLIFSSLTATGSSASVQALMAGAAECILKPQTADASTAKTQMTYTVVPVALALTGLADDGAVERRKGVPARRRLRRTAEGTVVSPTAGGNAGGSNRPAARRAEPKRTFDPPPTRDRPQVTAPAPRRRAGTSTPQILAIASSTGGPGALSTFLTGLGPLDVPVVIVQHIPASFTQQLALRLSESSGLDVAEATDGEHLVGGKVRIAPGGFHLLVQSSGPNLVASLNSGPKVQYVRPSADPMFESAAEACNGRVLGVVLTGMGRDGTDGARAIVDKGGEVVIQDEATSVVWGMPGSVAKHDLAAEILPLDELAATVRRRIPSAAKT